jgi:hypothetical protein
MKPRSLLAAGCLLLFAAGAFAQSGRAAGDPVTGKWGMDGQTFLELQFDGKSGVSGTAIWRGGGSEQRTEIKSGTFDVQTGALRLTGEARDRDGRVVGFLIEGTIENDVATGTYAIAGDKGAFRFTRE